MKKLIFIGTFLISCVNLSFAKIEFNFSIDNDHNILGTGQIYRYDKIPFNFYYSF